MPAKKRASERHKPFLEAAARAKPRTAAWHRYRAGLLVLEYLDHCWSGRRRNAQPSASRLLIIRRAIAAVRPKATRILLDDVLNHAIPGLDPLPEVLEALDRYAGRLANTGAFKLASHVYQTIIDAARQAHFDAVLPSAYEHYGSCLRVQGVNSERVVSCYRTGQAVAARCGAEHAAIRLMIAEGNLHRADGRLVEARTLLDAALDRAKQSKASELMGRAAHERGILAHELEDYLDALVYFSEAFRAFTGVNDRYRLLNDVGRALMELGYCDAARDAWLVVFLVAKGDRYPRWAAGINLMWAATLRGDAELFDQYRVALERAPMPVRLLVPYFLEVGNGSRQFGREMEARVAYKRAEILAARHGLDAARLRAANALRGHVDTPSQTPVRTDALPAVVTELMAAVSKLRSLPQLLGRSWRGDDETKFEAPRRTVLRRGRRPRSDFS